MVRLISSAGGSRLLSVAFGHRSNTSTKVTLDISGRQGPIWVNKNLRYAKEFRSWMAYAK